MSPPWQGLSSERWREALSTRPGARAVAAAGELRLSARDRAPVPSRRPVSSGAQINYRVRRNAAARRVKVRVDPQHGVEVLLPARAPLRVAAAAVAELAPWIERQLDALAQARGRLAPAGTLPYLDERLTLVVQEGRRQVHRRGDALLVPPASTRRPRSSAGIAARRARSSRGAWTPPPRPPAPRTRS